MTKRAFAESISLFLDFLVKNIPRKIVAFSEEADHNLNFERKKIKSEATFILDIFVEHLQWSYSLQ